MLFHVRRQTQEGLATTYVRLGRTREAIMRAAADLLLSRPQGTVEHLVQQPSIGRYRLHPLVRRATVDVEPEIGGTRG
jgi:hypothetical protein